jgi:hypothetical protein
MNKFIITIKLFHLQLNMVKKIIMLNLLILHPQLLLLYLKQSISILLLVKKLFLK